MTATPGPTPDECVVTFFVAFRVPSADEPTPRPAVMDIEPGAVSLGLIFDQDLENLPGSSGACTSPASPTSASPRRSAASSTSTATWKPPWACTPAPKPDRTSFWVPAPRCRSGHWAGTRTDLPGRIEHVMQVVAGMDPRAPLADIGAHARRVEALGFDALHVAETTNDAFITCALALEHTSTLVVRPGAGPGLRPQPDAGGLLDVVPGRLRPRPLRARASAPRSSPTSSAASGSSGPTRSSGWRTTWPPSAPSSPPSRRVARCATRVRTTA